MWDLVLGAGETAMNVTDEVLRHWKKVRSVTPWDERSDGRH